MKNIITFKARNKYEFDTHIKPYPASSAVPKWWKEMTPYHPTPEDPAGKKLIIANRESNASWKKCKPMFDAITSGYIIPLWCDVEIIQQDEQTDIKWQANNDVFLRHSVFTDKIERPIGYGPNIFKYLNTWVPITPKGYSCLVTSPIGYRQLPISPIPGLIDTDRHKVDVLFPVWIKEGFNGIIKKGTPLVQIIPFKRSDWDSRYEYFEDNEIILNFEKTFNTNIVNNYIRKFWSKKTYR